MTMNTLPRWLYQTMYLDETGTAPDRIASRPRVVSIVTFPGSPNTSAISIVGDYVVTAEQVHETAIANPS